MGAISGITTIPTASLGPHDGQFVSEWLTNAKYVGDDPATEEWVRKVRTASAPKES